MLTHPIQHMRFYAAVLMTFLFSVTVYGQIVKEDIHGTVVDSSTEQPVELANVVFLDKDSAFLCNTLTDSLGHFQVEMAEGKKPCFIEIVHICYDKASYRFQGDGMTFRLMPSDYHLDEVVIKGVRTKVKNRLNFEYVMTDAMVEKAKLTSKLLENIPTVYVDYNHDVYVRGSNRILILKDNVALMNNALIDQISPETVKKVEIMYNVPAKYADKNYTAIMNIVTVRKAGVSVMFDGLASADKEMYDAKTNVSLDTKKHSFYLFHKLYYRNLLEKKYINTAYTTPAKYTHEAFRETPRKECDNEFFWGYAFYLNENVRFGLDGYNSLYRENNLLTDLGANHLDFSHGHERMNSQDYKVYMAYEKEKDALKVEAAYNHINLSDNDEYYLPVYQMQQQEKRSSYQAELEYTRTMSDAVKFQLGAKYNYSRNKGLLGNVSDDGESRYRQNNLTFFAEADIAINEKWSLEAGANMSFYNRMFTDASDVNAFYISPVLVSSYAWNNNNNLNISFSSFTENPTIWHLLPFMKEVSMGLFTLGNPTLKPKRTNKFSCEYSYSKGDSYLSLSTYYHRIQNSIQNTMGENHEGKTVISYINEKRRHDYGFDVSISQKPLKWLSYNIYVDVHNRHISANEFYKKNLLSWACQGQIGVDFTDNLGLVLQYMHSSKELSLNGYSKPTDSSMAVLSYSPTSWLDLCLMYLHPFGKMHTTSTIYNDNGSIEQKSDIYAQKVLLSLTLNLVKGKRRTHRQTYENPDKKY